MIVGHIVAKLAHDSCVVLYVEVGVIVQQCYLLCVVELSLCECYYYAIFGVGYYPSVGYVGRSLKIVSFLLHVYFLFNSSTSC